MIPTIDIEREGEKSIKLLSRSCEWADHNQEVKLLRDIADELQTWVGHPLNDQTLDSIRTQVRRRIYLSLDAYQDLWQGFDEKWRYTP